MSEQLEAESAITRISVKGYKSLYDECSIEIRPLTILAGANSSGKSSIMQPLLLLKQTLEAPYDPGALKIDGPNVEFTSAQQFLSNKTGKKSSENLQIGLEFTNFTGFTNIFKKLPENEFEILQMMVKDVQSIILLHPDMTDAELASLLSENIKATSQDLIARMDVGWQWKITRNRCFFTIILTTERALVTLRPLLQVKLSELFEREIMGIIHVPGLRRNPERVYKTTAVGFDFPGTFENYVASVIYSWQSNKDRRLVELGEALKKLGLTRSIGAKQLNDTQIEIQVDRLPVNSKSTATDTVSIADVGLGISHILPVLVALLTAKPGQLVYIEQPELHLHPKAQIGLAQVIAEAANRGVRVVIETHSSSLLLTVQALVAEGELAPDKVKLHWFKRREDGCTEINSADLDEAGAFGEWPEDFDEVELKLQDRYLTASEARLVNS